MSEIKLRLLLLTPLQKWVKVWKNHVIWSMVV